MGSRMPSETRFSTKMGPPDKKTRDADASNGGSGTQRSAAPGKPLPATPGAALVRIFVAFSFGWFMVPWLLGLLVTSGERWYGPPPFEARAQLRSIRRRLGRGDADDMDRLFPEGKLFSYTFYCFSLVNMATANPHDAAFRKHARAELERILPLVEAEVDAPRFEQSRDLVPRGGVIPAGQANLLRAGYVLLGGADRDIIGEFHATSSLLYSEFMKSAVVSLETYPQMIWPVDNCCALESLRLHDGLYDTEYAGACRRWAEWMATHLDSETGMMVAQVSKRGHVLDGPRGCAISWSLAFMPAFAPTLARSQYERYRSEWFIHVLGMTGAREWAPGREGEMDADTGPVVFGIGAAASGLGIAAAKANGDAANLTRMLRGMDLVSFPVWGPRGKHYFLGGALLADELALWGKTARIWDSPPTEDRPQPWPEPGGGGFWFIYLVALVTCVLAFLAATRWAVQVTIRARRTPWRWERGPAIAFALEAAAIFAWLVFPGINWLYAAVLLGLTDVVETRLVVLRRLARNGTAARAGQ